jgi:hypothetical protein
MSVHGPSRRFAACSNPSGIGVKRTHSAIADPTAVIQTPYPPADLNARGGRDN